MISSDATDEYGPGPEMSALRWLGAEDDPAGRVWHKPTDPAVQELRAKLEQHSGMKGLELVDPKEAGFAKKAAKIFLRDGFVAVLNVLDPERLEVCRAGCIKVVRRILATDPTAGGNGHPSYVHSSHRYSITGEGAVIGHMGATPEFAYFCDPPVLSEVLTEIYGSKDYICNGFGGDFCLPGCVAFQPLHSDMAGAFKVKKQERDDPEYEDRLSLSEPNEPDAEYEYKNGFHDPSGKLDYRDLPPSYVVRGPQLTAPPVQVANYPMELVPFSQVGGSVLNGATRQIPGTQNSKAPIPTIDEEPDWMKFSTCVTPAGAVLLRDPRAWHGGCPNVSDHARAIPSAGFLAPWCALNFRGNIEQSMSPEVYATLSEHGKRVCRHLVYQGPKPYPETIFDTQSALSLGKLLLPMGCEVARL